MTIITFGNELLPIANETMAEPIAKFDLIDTFEMSGRGTVLCVDLDRDCNDPAWMNGEIVEVDGHQYKVRGVERFAHCPPFVKGERVGLLI